jgi:hypothetical protein
VTQHDDRIDPSRRSFGCTNHSTERRLYSEELEIIAGDPRHQDASRTGAFRSEPDEANAISRNILKDVTRPGSVILEIGKRHRPQTGCPRSTAAEHYQPMTIPDGQWSEQECVHHTEDGRVDAYAQSERQNSRERKRPTVAHRANCVTEVVEEIREPAHLRTILNPRLRC